MTLTTGTNIALRSLEVHVLCHIVGGVVCQVSMVGYDSHGMVLNLRYLVL